MSVSKPINKSEFTIRSTRVNKRQTLNTGSEGLIVGEYLSSSFNNDSNYLDSSTYNFYNSLFVNFYSSASYSSTNKYSPYHTITDTRVSNPVYLNKFYETGSYISIPQQYYGERIKPGTLQITNLNISSSTSDDMIIKDDGYGNLYSTNAEHSQSGVTSISSSENYIGNVFYDFGVISITETGSWSGSKNYTDSFVDKDLDIQFNATQTIYVREYTVTIKPKDFNTTMNPMIRGFNSGSSTITKHTDSSVVYTDFTESTWRPYYNQINLYSEDSGEPLIVARLPRPVKVRDNMSITYKIRLDI